MTAGRPITVHYDDNLLVYSQTPLCCALPRVQEIIELPASLLDVDI